MVRSIKTGMIRRMALDDATGAVLGVQKELAAQRCRDVGVPLGPDAYVWSQAPDYTEPLGRTELSVHARREIDTDSDYRQQAGDGCDHRWPPGGIEWIAVVGEESDDLAVLHKAQNQ